MPDSDSATFTANEPLRCGQCGTAVAIAPGESTASCPNCGAMLPAPPQIASTAPPADDERQIPPWLLDPGAILGEPGQYLCFEDEDEIVVVPLTREWTRIGRGLAADVRFDDPTVSRRHALIVRNVDGVRVLDDRSLNGVFVNGHRVEWSPLTHGDEIRVGRHNLYYATLEPVGAEAAPSTTAS
jgi:pSer/pThr/pTyr-binding forkhead associated (FHA) protein